MPASHIWWGVAFRSLDDWRTPAILETVLSMPLAAPRELAYWPLLSANMTANVSQSTSRCRGLIQLFRCRLDVPEKLLVLSSSFVSLYSGVSGCNMLQPEKPLATCPGWMHRSSALGFSFASECVTCKHERQVAQEFNAPASQLLALFNKVWDFLGGDWDPNSLKTLFLAFDMGQNNAHHPD